MKRIYPTNLTDNQYTTILQIICNKRKRKHSLREIFNAILYLLKSGCQWRMLPIDLPNPTQLRQQVSPLSLKAS